MNGEISKLFFFVFCLWVGFACGLWAPLSPAYYRYIHSIAGGNILIRVNYLILLFFHILLLFYDFQLCLKALLYCLIWAVSWKKSFFFVVFIDCTKMQSGSSKFFFYPPPRTLEKMPKITKFEEDFLFWLKKSLNYEISKTKVTETTIKS